MDRESGNFKLSTWPCANQYTVTQDVFYTLTPHELQSLIHGQRLIGSGKWEEIPLPSKNRSEHLQNSDVNKDNLDVNKDVTPPYCESDGEPTGELKDQTNVPENEFPPGYGKTKPIFMNEQTVLGLGKINKRNWLTGEEIFLSIAEVIDDSHLTGIQRTGKYWRIYVDNTEDRITLLQQGINLREKTTGFIPENPKTPNLFT